MRFFSSKIAIPFSLLCSASLFSVSPSTQEAHLLKRVKEYWKEGDFSTAKKQILSYLEEAPDTAIAEEMHLLLGDLYLKEGNFVSALAEYDLIEKKELVDKIFYNKALCWHETQNDEKLIEIAEHFASQPLLTPEQKNSLRYLCATTLFEKAVSTSSAHLFVKAKELFLSCKGTSFEPFSWYPLARIYEQEGDKNQSASYYEASSKSYPEVKDDLIFQAALLRSETTPELAISLFTKLFTSASSKSGEALYNCLLLQYKTKQFSSFASTYDMYHAQLSIDQEATIFPLFGKSLYRMGEYQKAIDPLMEIYKKAKDSSSQNPIHLMLLVCAYETQNLDLYQRLFRSHHSFLAQDPGYTKAHLMYLHLLKEKKRYGEYIEESKAFIEQNPDHAEKEQVLWDAAHFLYEVKRWEEADRLFALFIEDHPASPSIATAWRIRLNAAVLLLENSPSDHISRHRKHLIQIITQALEEPHACNGQEKETLAFELVKNLFLEHRFQETVEKINTLFTEDAKIRFGADLAFLKLLCYFNDPTFAPLRCEYAESFLKQFPLSTEIDKVHLHLFNEYIHQASSTETKDLILHKAANHLYALFKRSPCSLQKENLTWLAEHYFGLAEKMGKDPLAPQEEKQIYLVRSEEIFEALLPQETTLQNSVETTLLRLSQILSWSEQWEKKVALLRRFMNENMTPQTSIQKQLLLDFAKAHEKTGSSVQALDVYQALIRNCPASSTQALAILERSKLLSSHLPQEQWSEDNPLFLQNINDLKSLEVQRSLLSEPLHLEAGLEYVLWKAALVQDPLEQKKKQIQLLQLLQENFQSELTSEETEEPHPFAKDQEQILVAYLLFAEAEVYRLQADIADLSEKPLLYKKAQEKIVDLKTKSSLPDPLKKRIAYSEQELGKIL